MKITVEASNIDELLSLLMQLTASHRSKGRESVGTSIDSLELTVRAANCLKAEDIYTVEQLLSHSEQELLRIPNLARKSLIDINLCLAKRGLALKPNEPERKREQQTNAA